MKRVSEVEDRIIDIYQKWPDTQRSDQIHGIGPVAAVSILPSIGPIERFVDAEELIAYTGLVPGIRQSDGTSRARHIGSGGTDTHLCFYLNETSV